jgi:hypothetical protein
LGRPIHAARLGGVALQVERGRRPRENFLTVGNGNRINVATDNLEIRIQGVGGDHRIVARGQPGAKIEDRADAVIVKIADDAPGERAIVYAKLPHQRKLLLQLIRQLTIHFEIVCPTQPIINHPPGVGTSQIVVHPRLLLKIPLSTKVTKEHEEEP